jgi:drug/metabolite transporter (DMT)-like permease
MLAQIGRLIDMVRLRQNGLLLLSVCLIASSYIFTQLSLNNLSPITIAALRVTIVTPIFGLLMLIRKTRGPQLRLSGLLLFSVTLVILPQILIAIGVSRINAVSSSFIEASEPLLTVVLGAIILRERFKVQHAVGLILAIIGTVVIATKGFTIGLGQSSLIGVLAVAGSASSLAISNIVGKRLLDDIAPDRLLTTSMAVGALCLLPIAITLHPMQIILAFTSPHVLFALLGLSLLATGGGYTLYFYALKTLSASRVSSFLYAIPVFTAVEALFLLGDAIPVSVIWGGLLIMSGVLMMQIRLLNHSKEVEANETHTLTGEE